MDDYRDRQPRRAGTSAPRPTPPRRTTPSTSFVEDPTFLSEVVRFDLPRLGDVTGLRGVHLQCHIGTDTLSLARLGAQMTGLDFSGRRARRGSAAGHGRAGTARRLRRVRRLRRRSTCSRRAASTWCSPGSARSAGCPTSDRWAGVVAGPAPPGRPALHPRGPPDALVARRAERRTGCSSLDYPYFEREEPLVLTRAGTYVETDVVFENNTTPRVEPRPRRDRDGAARRGPRAHDARRARQRAVGRAARPDGADRPGEYRLIDRPVAAARTATRCRP